MQTKRDIVMGMQEKIIEQFNEFSKLIVDKGKVCCIHLCYVKIN